jgi:hypothetical protein
MATVHTLQRLESDTNAEGAAQMAENSKQTDITVSNEWTVAGQMTSELVMQLFSLHLQL